MLMDVRDTFGELKHDLAGLLWRKVMATHQIKLIAKGSAIDVFVGHIWPSIDDAVSENFDDIWVIKRGACDAFMLKTLDVLRVVHHVFAHDFKGNGLMKDDIEGLINIGHATMGYPSRHAVTVVYFLTNLNHC